MRRRRRATRGWWHGRAVMAAMVMAAAAGLTACGGDDGPASAPAAEAEGSRLGGEQAEAGGHDIGGVRTPPGLVVAVLNDAGVAGAAGRLAGDLMAAGYQLSDPAGSNATRAGDAAQTEVLYRAGYEQEAHALAMHLGAPSGAVRALGDDAPGPVGGAQLVVVVGLDLATVPHEDPGPAPEPEPEAEGDTCREVVHTNGSVAGPAGERFVIRPGAGVTCAEAVEVASTYFDDLPAEAYQGSGAFAEVGQWECGQNPPGEREATGRVGSCRHADGRTFELWLDEAAV